MRKLKLGILTAAALAAPSAVLAQASFPTKPVRLMIGYTPGSEIDVVGRLLAEQLSERWGQRVIVDNRSGAGGTLAATTVARSTADGYTWLFNSVSHTASGALYAKLPYDPVRDFAFVSQATSAPNVLLVAPSQGIKSTAALIAAAKSKPGQLTYGSAGLGSGTHINGTLFTLAADIKVENANYKGTPELIAETATGRINYSFSPIGSTLAFVKEGRLVALGVTTLQRSPSMPDVPTIAETALPGFEWDQWYGMMMPAGTPRAIVEKVSVEMREILLTPAIKEKLNVRGSWPNVNTPEQFTKKVRAETEKVGKALAMAGVKPQ